VSSGVAGTLRIRDVKAYLGSNRLFAAGSGNDCYLRKADGWSRREAVVADPRPWTPQLGGKQTFPCDASRPGVRPERSFDAHTRAARRDARRHVQVSRRRLICVALDCVGRFRLDRPIVAQTRSWRTIVRTPLATPPPLRFPAFPPWAQSPRAQGRGRHRRRLVGRSLGRAWRAKGTRAAHSCARPAA
jgi:hypothetical protein